MWRMIPLNKDYMQEYISFKTNELVQFIEFSKTEDGPFFVAIDGQYSSGKTTFANVLARKLDAALISIEDYVTEDGKPSLESFEKEVLVPLKQKTDATFHIKQKGEVMEEVVPYKEIVLVEGLRSMSECLRKYYDLMIFFEVEKEDQIQRIKKLDSHYTDEEIEKFQKEEQDYFEKENVRNHSDYYISTSVNEEYA